MKFILVIISILLLLFAVFMSGKTYFCDDSVDGNHSSDSNQEISFVINEFGNTPIVRNLKEI